MRQRFAVALALVTVLALGWIWTVLKTDTIEFTDPPAHVAGLSGLVVSPDGAQFTAIGDRNVVVRGRLLRTDGVLTGAEVDDVAQLRDWKGRPYLGPWNDAEGVAVTQDGHLVVSFEYQFRVAQFDDALNGTLLPPLPPLQHVKGNNGFEALAIDPAGRPIIILEGSPTERDLTYVYRQDGDDWTRIANLARSDRFLPTGADFGPDGALYVLERQVGLRGFRSRIRRVEIADEGLMTGDIVWTATRGHGNLEGLSIWTDATGALRATMVADNNEWGFLPGGFTEIVLAKPDGAE